MEIRWTRSSKRAGSIPVEPRRQCSSTTRSLCAKAGSCALGPTERDARAIHARHRAELPSHVLIPGLVNLHTHAAMTLMRGLADDRPLMDWLKQPHLAGRRCVMSRTTFVYDGTLLACAEMLRGGITLLQRHVLLPRSGRARPR